MLRRLVSRFDDGSISKASFIDQMAENHRHLFDYAHYISETDISEIRIIDKEVWFKLKNTNLWMVENKLDKRTAPFEILNFKHYEMHEAKIIFSLIEPDFTILDIGANVGWYAMNFALIANRGQVLAFEPVRSIFELLCRNKQINNLHNLKCYPLGFAETEKEVDFYVPSEMSVASSAVNLLEDPQAERVRCQLKPLDLFLEKESLKVDFIKCDVEGGELFVFQGAPHTLSRDRPMVFAEVLRKWSARFGYHPNDLLRLFQALDYEVFGLGAEGLTSRPVITEETPETNFLFCPKEKKELSFNKVRKAGSPVR